MKTETKQETVRACAMSKKELAQRYLPHLTPHSAVNRLMSWVQYNPRLVSELEETGYRLRQQMLTARQVELIFRYLGEP